MRRMTAIAVMLLVPLMLLGAAGRDGIFRAAMTTNPQSLDEGYSTTTATRQVSSYVYETLFTFAEDYSLIPQLADTYSISGNGLIYNIKIRQGIVFHNDKPLGAEDVKASLERFGATPLTGGRFKAVKSIDIVNPYEIKVTLDRPFLFLLELALPSRPVIMPKDIALKYMAGEIKPADVIGTGPYKLISWTPDVAVRLGKFDKYVEDGRYDKASGLGGKRTAQMAEVQLVPVPEAASRIAGLQTGDFDYAESLPVTSFDRLNTTAGVKPMIIKPRWSIVVEMNKAEWPVSDVRFRKALVYALDMEKVLKAVTTNKPEFYRIDPSLFTPEQAYFTTAGSLDIYNKQNLDKVKSLLKEVNYQGQKITYLVNKDFDWMYKACLSLSQQWQEAGINVELQFHDWTSQIKKAQSLKDWHLNQSGWSPRLDPSIVDSAFNSKSPTSSYNYNNPTMDALLEKIRQDVPLAQRKQTWATIQELVWTDLPMIKLGDYFELEAIRSTVKGYTPFYVIPRFWNVTN